MRTAIVAFVLFAVFAATPEASGRAATASEPAPRCFLSRDWEGWRATPDLKSFYARVGIADIYRFDLANACAPLQDPDVHIVTRLHQTWICDAMDVNVIQVSNGHGLTEPCLVTKITPLTRAQAAALPKGLRP